MECKFLMTISDDIIVVQFDVYIIRYCIERSIRTIIDWRSVFIFNIQMTVKLIRYNSCYVNPFIK